jgi:threonine aldolase
MGGTLRQAGIIAAPGLIGLRHLIDRLAEDHQNARIFAEGVNALEGLSVDLDSVQSNIINLEVGGLGIDAATFASHLDPLGVRGLPGMGTVVRFVTYRDITRDQIHEALSIIGSMMDTRPWA